MKSLNEAEFLDSLNEKIKARSKEEDEIIQILKKFEVELPLNTQEQIERYEHLLDLLNAIPR